MPDNTIGWGQAAANNSNGYGAGAQNNSIDWGYIHSRSYGHDETDLVGATSFFNVFGQSDLGWSLKDLSGDGGTILTVRRSSDNAENDFTANDITNGNLVSWVGVGNDGRVKTVWDQGSANEPLEKTVASAQPYIVQAGSLVVDPVNGEPALYSDSTSPVSGTIFLETGGIAGGTQPITSFSILHQDFNGGIIGGNTANRMTIFGDGGAHRLFNSTTVLTGKAINNTYFIYWLVNGVNSEYAFNDDATTTGVAGTANLDKVQIFRDQASRGYGGGYWQESIYYFSDKSADLESIRASRNSVYNIF